MESTLIGVENDRRYHQAEQDGANQCGQRTGGRTVRLHHVDAHHAVADAVAQGSDQQDLLNRENGQRGHGIAAQEHIADQQRDGPVDDDRQDPPSRAGHGPGAGFREAQPLPRVLGNAGGVRPAEPRTDVFAIYHPPSLASRPQSRRRSHSGWAWTTVWTPYSVYISVGSVT